MADNCLDVRLLGKPELRWRGHLLESVPPKLRALLFYLAVRGKPVARSEIEELFWGSKSNHSLRQALYQLHSLPGAEDWLQANGAVALRARTDLAAFEVAVSGGFYKEALAVWQALLPPSEGRAALLWGFELDHALAFSDWLEVERARIEMLYLEALQHRASELEVEGRYSEALTLVQTLLREDPLNESAYRLAMRLCYRRGRPQDAQAYFEHCRRVLLEELGVHPLEETVRLAHHPGAISGHARPEALTLRQALERLPDPRSRYGQRYPLVPLMGLVLLAFLCGAHSLRDIVRFGREHPDLMQGLGFQQLTPPGRSALSALLKHLDLSQLRQTLASVASLPHTPEQGASKEAKALGLIESWALELRHRLDFTETGWLSAVLERLGWSGLVGWVWAEWLDWLRLVAI